jgi:two-component system sensor histidine kinase YesM
MLLVFMFLILATGGIIAFFSMVVYRYHHLVLTKTYLSDVTRQTTNNLEERILKIEDINVQLLTNTAVQKQLSILADADETDQNLFELRNIGKTLKRELESFALPTSDVVSMSIVSDKGDVFSVNKVTGRGIEFAFNKEEIYAAKGTTLWGVVGSENDICIAKAILNLSTMKPIGYISMVYESEYLSNIVKDNSTEYSAAAYVVDENQKIVATNREQYILTTFPYELQQLRQSDTQYENLDGKDYYYYIGNEMPNGWTLVEAVSVREFHKRTNEILIATGSILAVIFLLGFLSVQMAAKRITRPTQELLQSMKLFGKGTLTQRVEVRSADEIGQIGSEFNQLADNIENLIEKVYLMQISQKQAEIDFLCMQINPHFLYNTLDTISWLSFAEGNQNVSELVVALAELLRAMVKKERFISLGEEMKMVKDYLFIQKQRFGDQLSIHYDIDEAAYAYTVPSFLLQPLIENAIIHGIEPKIETGNLWISIGIDQENLCFQITDDGVGMTEEEIKRLYEQCKSNDTKQNIGLKNVYRRLLLCFGEDNCPKITSEEGNGTTIQFSIPMQTADTTLCERKESSI